MSKPQPDNFLVAVVVALVLLIPPQTLATATGSDSKPNTKLEFQAEGSRVLAQIPKISQGENLSFEIEPGWKLGSSAEQPDDYSIAEYVREGDDIENWHELLVIYNFVLKPQLGSPEKMFNSLKKTREQECPGVTTWNVIQKDEKSILYEWQAKSCLGWPDQHEIARIIDGKYNRFMIRYTAKIYQLEPSQRSKWIDRFSQAKIILKEVPSGVTKFIWREDIFQPSKDLEEQIMKTIFLADMEVAPNCRIRAFNPPYVFRETPLLLEEGEGYRWLHHLEKWEFKRCNQLVSYLAWYTFDESHPDQTRLIVRPIDEAQELAEQQPAFKELLQYKSHSSSSNLKNSE